jgi:hypothetical protein
VLEPPVRFFCGRLCDRIRMRIVLGSSSGFASAASRSFGYTCRRCGTGGGGTSTDKIVDFLHRGVGDFWVM